MYVRIRVLIIMIIINNITLIFYQSIYELRKVLIEYVKLIL